MSNLNNQNWVKSLRTIDGYVDVTPNVNNGSGKVDEIILSRGGFNNSMVNYREATNNTGIIVKIDTDNNGNVLAYYSYDSGRNWETCSGLPTTWKLNSGVSAYSNLSVICRYIYGIKSFIAIFSNDGTTKYDYDGYSEVYTSKNGKDWELFNTYNSMIYDVDYSTNGVMLFSGCPYFYAYSSSFGESTLNVASDAYNYRRLKYIYSSDEETFVAIPDQTSKQIKKVMVDSSTGAITMSNDIMPSTINGSYTGDIQFARYGSDNEYQPSVFAVVPVYNYYNLGIVSTVAFLITDDLLSDRTEWRCTQAYNITLDDSNEVYWSADSNNGIVKQNIAFSEYNPEGENTIVFTMPSMKKALYSKDFGETWTFSDDTNDVLFAPNGVVYQGNKFYTSNGYASYNGKSWNKVFNTKYTRFYPTSTFCNGINNSIPNILTYDPQKKLGFFDGETASINLQNYSLSSNSIEYASSVSSDANGRLNVEFEIYTNGGNFRYLEIVGDIARREFPVDFEIDLGDNANSIDPDFDLYGKYKEKHTGNYANGEYAQTTHYYVTGNNLVHCIIDFGEIKNTNNPITLKITKWSTPFTCAKINYIGTDIRYAFTSKNLLKDFSLSTKLKDEREIGYGIRYNEAKLSIYNGEYSSGKYSITYYSYDNGSLQSYRNDVVKPLNIIQVLVDAPVDTYFKFFVKETSDTSYNMIGRYYSNKVDYNTQSDIITVSMSDVLYRLQSYDYSGPNLRYKYIYSYVGDTLYNIISNIDKDLREQFGIKINYNVEDLKRYTIKNVKFNVDTVWELLENCCNTGLFYIVPEHTNEDYDIKILYRR